MKGCKRKRGSKQRENKLIKRGFKRKSSGVNQRGDSILAIFTTMVQLTVAFVVVFVVCCFLPFLQVVE